MFLPDVYLFLLYKLAYKVFHNLGVPNSLQLFFNRIHCTRVASHNFFVPGSRLKIYHDNPILTSIRLCNNLSNVIKLSPSFNVFKYSIIQLLFTDYV